MNTPHFAMIFIGWLLIFCGLRATLSRGSNLKITFGCALVAVGATFVAASAGAVFQ